MADPAKVFSKCAWRLIPFMMLLYVVSFIDRTNVGFAALTMNKDLGFSPSVFGLGAGLFFVTYNLCQVPATNMLRRFGARRMVFWVMLVWGLLAASNAFVSGTTSFFALRLLLGIAEAGFFPGMLFYLTLWFPSAYRGRFSGTFSTGIPLAGIVGGPLSGVILGLDGMAGLHGWQWLFLLEGLPASLLAFAVLKFLPDGPANASWLDEEEKHVIRASLAGEAAKEDLGPWAVLADRRLWAIGGLGFMNGCSVYGLAFWLPQIIQSMGFSNRATGFLSALPYLAAMVAMIYWGRSSDIRGDRFWHFALCFALVAISFSFACLLENPVLVLLALTAGVMGVYAAFGPFYSLPSTFLRGASAASGIALVNTIASLSGIVGPLLIGVVKEHTGSYKAAMVMLILMEVIGLLGLMAMRGFLRLEGNPVPSTSR
jgi:MFS transporter, ACS family, tartrate transporter